MEKMTIDELIEKLQGDAIDLEHNELLTREVGDASAPPVDLIKDVTP